jgi:uncharacterized damage-inducible protein DinB
VADDQKSLLQSYLAAQRRHVLGILDGLSDEQLRRPVLPSGWSCASLVQHLTVDVERLWFGAAVAGDRAAVEAVMNDDVDGWVLDASRPAGEVLDAYRQQAARSDAIIEQTAIDAAPQWWPVHLFGEWRLDSLGDVLLHVITESATHAGHLDGAREMIDGRQWLVLTD